MAALYDFCFVVRHAEFKTKLVIIPHGTTAYVFHQECAQLTYAAAKDHLAALSAKEKRSHKAILTLKYRDDRCPPGFKQAPNHILYEAAATAAA